MYINNETIDGLISILENEGVKELLDAYVLSTKDVIDHLKSASVADDINQIKFYSHRLKGSSGTLGLEHMQQLGKNIETFCKVGDVENAKIEIKKVSEAFSNTIEDLKENYPKLF